MDHFRAPTLIHPVVQAAVELWAGSIGLRVGSSRRCVTVTSAKNAPSLSPQARLHGQWFPAHALSEEDEQAAGDNQKHHHHDSYYIGDCLKSSHGESFFTK